MLTQHQRLSVFIRGSNSLQTEQYSRLYKLKQIAEPYIADCTLSALYFGFHVCPHLQLIGRVGYELF